MATRGAPPSSSERPGHCSRPANKLAASCPSDAAPPLLLGIAQLDFGHVTHIEAPASIPSRHTSCSRLDQAASVQEADLARGNRRAWTIGGRGSRRRSYLLCPPEARLARQTTRRQRRPAVEGAGRSRGHQPPSRPRAPRRAAASAGVPSDTAAARGGSAAGAAAGIPPHGISNSAAELRARPVRGGGPHRRRGRAAARVRRRRPETRRRYCRRRRRGGDRRRRRAARARCARRAAHEAHARVGVVRREADAERPPHKALRASPPRRRRGSERRRAGRAPPRHEHENSTETAARIMPTSPCCLAVVLRAQCAPLGSCR